MPSAIFPLSSQRQVQGCRWEPLTGSRAREQSMWDDSLTFKFNHYPKCEHDISHAVVLWWISSKCWVNLAFFGPLGWSGLLKRLHRLSPSLPYLCKTLMGAFFCQESLPITTSNSPYNMTVTIYASMLQGILTIWDSVLSCIHFHL